MTLEKAIKKVKPLDRNAMDIAQKRWDSIEATAFSWKTGNSVDPDCRNYGKCRDRSFQERPDRHVC